MKVLDKYEVWFVTGSQSLYGEETLKQVAQHAYAMVDFFNKNAKLPVKLVCKPVVKSPDEITQMAKDANYEDGCAGIITWMHTFSPSKMWINGLKQMGKPMLHLHTQFHREIPVNEIDMDFMNTNQSAHGDREHGFIGARMRLKRKVVAGYYQDEEVAEGIGTWMRAAVGAMESQKLKAVRFGDNMREVAVTEGDKVEAQIRLGWSVNTYGIGALVAEMEKISAKAVEERFVQYQNDYDIKTDNVDAVKYQIKIELALETFFERHEFGAFTTSFEDLYGMEQLPGMASQSMMKQGYGFGGEGDWKVACLTRLMKLMGEDVRKGTTFMEDYTYHLAKGEEAVLGAHMLEVCPSIAARKPSVVVKPLGIGGKDDPARYVFDGKEGPAVYATLVDMGDRFRLIVADVYCIKPIAPMPNLPVACTIWRLLPNFKTATEAWILAGGAHHSVLSYDLTMETMRDFAEMMDIEFVHIGKNTTTQQLKQDLLVADLVWKLR